MRDAVESRGQTGAHCLSLPSPFQAGHVILWQSDAQASKEAAEWREGCDVRGCWRQSRARDAEAAARETEGGERAQAGRKSTSRHSLPALQRAAERALAGTF